MASTQSPMAISSSSAKQILTGFIRGYQYFLSPLIGHTCRFYPSCSHYAIEAINHHGLLKGTAFAGKRILSCHPWHPGGVDLVPEKNQQRER